MARDSFEETDHIFREAFSDKDIRGRLTERSELFSRLKDSYNKLNTANQPSPRLTPGEPIRPRDSGVKKQQKNMLEKAKEVIDNLDLEIEKKMRTNISNDRDLDLYDQTRHRQQCLDRQIEEHNLGGKNYIHTDKEISAFIDSHLKGFERKKDEVEKEPSRAELFLENSAFMRLQKMEKEQEKEKTPEQDIEVVLHKLCQ